MIMRTVAAVLLFVCHAASAVDAPGAAALDQWLAHQADVETWSAEVTQRRRLKSLAQPLESHGHVWFAQPNRFRWELGSPPRTVAVRSGEALLVAYPRLGQVERYAYGEQDDPALKQALALLEVGLPADPAGFHARYDLIDAARSGDVWRFQLEPSASGARRLIERVDLEVSADDWHLVATELVFPDGSTMRNEFSHLELDPELPDGLFELDIPPAAGATAGSPEAQ